MVLLRVAGLLWPIAVPGSSSMAPTISKGDGVITEGFTFLTRKPQRGDVIVFRTGDLPSVPERQLWTKRIVGLPGERLRIADGKVCVNGSPVLLTNTQGEITYLMPLLSEYGRSMSSIADNEGVVVPVGSYFVLGDNSTNSFDSRFWGFLPAQNIIGRVWFCYYPIQRMGLVK